LKDVWLRAWEALADPGRFDGTNFWAWVCTIAHRLVIDRARRRRATADLAAGGGDPVDHRGGPQDTMAEQAERRAALTRCLDRLSPEERTVFEARLGGNSPREAAAALGAKVERVYKLSHDAKARLRACLERPG
jgi:RNA polymerase sigma-70 factor (ECF subfamily)